MFAVEVIVAKSKPPRAKERKLKPRVHKVIDVTSVELPSLFLVIDPGLEESVSEPSSFARLRRADSEIKHAKNKGFYGMFLRRAAATGSSSFAGIVRSHRYR